MTTILVSRNKCSKCYEKSPLSPITLVHKEENVYPKDFSVSDKTSHWQALATDETGWTVWQQTMALCPKCTTKLSNAPIPNFIAAETIKEIEIKEDPPIAKPPVLVKNKINQSFSYQHVAQQQPIIRTAPVSNIKMSSIPKTTEETVLVVPSSEQAISDRSDIIRPTFTEKKI